MSAPAAARSLFRIPFTAFRQIEAGEKATSKHGSNPQIDQARIQSIAKILRTSGYTVAQLSARTRIQYGTRSPYFIPATFLYKLRSGVTPHICQIAALSESSGYRFLDWMRMFGFDLRHIPRLQMRVHAANTVLITPVDFESHSLSFPSSSTHCTERGLSAGFHLRFGDEPEEGLRCFDGRYCFAKIGSRDASVSPKLIPGEIVRVDRCYPRMRLLAKDAYDENLQQRLLWLVEQPEGLTCCHLKWIDDHQIVLLPSRPPWGSLPLRLPGEARVLGLLDLKDGPDGLKTSRSRAVPCEFNPPHSPLFGDADMKFSDLFRAGRCRTGLTFRAAHRLSRTVAQMFDSRDYAIGLGLLSDYEAAGRLPRHIAKIITLCIIYCLDIRQVMEAAGVFIDDSDKAPLPAVDSFAESESNLFARSGHKSNSEDHGSNDHGRVFPTHDSHSLSVAGMGGYPRSRSWPGYPI
jgi:hypothetical protein